jgi:hypothetical protein
MADKKKAQEKVVKAAPYVRHANQRDYICGRAALHTAAEKTTEILPDAALVQGVWDGTGALTGVRVLTSGNTVRHSCGNASTLASLTDAQSKPTASGKWAGQL